MGTLVPRVVESLADAAFTPTLGLLKAKRALFHSLGLLILILPRLLRVPELGERIFRCN